MHADTPFFDTSYLVRLYVEDAGFEAVREVASAAFVVAAAWHAQAEVVAALHRVYRERRMDRRAFLAAMAQFETEFGSGVFDWLPLTDGVQERLTRVFRQAPATVCLRAADALHLACAAEHGFSEVYSNDRQLLAAAPLFGLKGVNVL